MSINDCAHWDLLSQHKTSMTKTNIAELFANDPERVQKLSITALDLFVDYSKHRITPKTMELLVGLAETAHLEQAIKDMFNGEKINKTEDRAVLHTALRNRSNRAIVVDGKDVMPDVNAVLDQMSVFSKKIRSGEWKGHTGKSIKNIVNIGIGGSDLGPVMAYEALKFYSDRNLTFTFVSNVDATHLNEALIGLKAEETLFIVASKTFTTQETMTNASSARDWLLQQLKDDARCTEAKLCLDRPDLSINEVALQMGFTDPSAFHRSFKKWTSRTPGQFRGSRRRPGF